MAPHTGASVSARPGTGFDLTFQANTTIPWTFGTTTGPGPLGFGMAGNTSRSTN
jgi:hypothetical protein